MTKALTICPNCGAKYDDDLNADGCACGGELLKTSDPVANRVLVEGEDFYYDKGSFVFTETYHKRRGFCCENGCRHCPWRAR